MDIEDENILNLDELSLEEKSKLFKVWKTLNKMMEDRGYEKDANSNFNFEDFTSYLKETKKLQGFFTKLDPSNPEARFRTYYEYIPTPKLNNDKIKTFFEVMKDCKVDSGIIIIPSSGKFSQIAKQKLDEINTQIQIEVFTLGELVVNITEHELVPKHIRLSEEEKKQLLKRYKVKENQLPKILITDPVAKYLGLKRGEVVKIVRISETAGRYITYRITC